MASTMRAPAAQRSAFFSSAKPMVPSVVRAGPASRASAVAPKAFLGGLFGGDKAEKGDAASPKLYICTVCGYVYDGDFAKAPSSYKCPACSVPKSKFKPWKGATKGRVNNAQSAMDSRFKAKQW
ncbi:hypothetical protein FOA52_000890 [Chlamydomonas sp. UWO 241]|nr:hypothetical protein FOA52_000890 [Chlamydomonas sp. UWO 241]